MVRSYFAAGTVGLSKSKGREPRQPVLKENDVADPRRIQLLESDLRSAVVAIRGQMKTGRDKQFLDQFLPLICRSLRLEDSESKLPRLLNLRVDHPLTITYKMIWQAIIGLWEFYSSGIEPKYVEKNVQMLTTIGMHGWSGYRVAGSLTKGFHLVRNMPT
jgi:hypothetical protein